MTTRFDNSSITDHNNQSQADFELVSPFARRSIDGLFSYQSQDQRSRFDSHRTSLAIVSERSPVMFERDHSEDRGSVGGIRLPTETSYQHAHAQRPNLMGSLPKIDTKSYFGTSSKRNSRSRSSGRRMASGSAESIVPTRAMPHLDSASTSNTSSPRPHVPRRQLQYPSEDSPIHQGGASYLAQLIKSNAVIDAHAPALQQAYQQPHFMQPFMPVHPSERAVKFSEISPLQKADPLLVEWETHGGPTLEELFENVPFIDLFRSTAYKVARKAVSYGVVKILDVST